jgi:MoxR-like ATPase
MLEYYEEIKRRIVGRDTEIKNILATLDAGKHLILEGPPGTTKSTILRTITEVCGIPFYMVEGNVDLTPSKLVGHFNPSKVMADDYRQEYFEKGPLTRAMEGGILYIEEFNRVPADTANVLITAVEEGELVIPRYGVVKAAPEFRLICAQNPYDDVGTLRISRAIYDRLCRISLGYQGELEEREIVRRKTGNADERLLRIAVRVARETRRHPEIKQGASVRGAIDMVAIAEQLRRMPGEQEEEVLRAAMLSAMSGKIWLEETTERTAEEILEEILRNVLRQPDIQEPAPQPPTPDDDDNEGPGGNPKSNDPHTDEGRSDAQEPHLDLGASQQTDPPWMTGWMGNTRQEILSQLKRMVRAHPEEVSKFLHANRELAEEILRSPDVLELYGYISPQLDPELREIAKRYASRLIVQMASQIANLGMKSGPLHRVPGSPTSDEIEIDATMERIIDHPTRPLEENLVVLGRHPEQKACVVMLDHSHSMTGIKISMAALTAAVIALHFKRDYGVVTFNTQARVLKSIAVDKSPTQTVSEILSLQAHGYTNIRQALELGIREIKRYDRKIGILITDGDWTYGGDPLQAARLFDELHVIGTEEPLVFEETYDEFSYYHRADHYHSMKIAMLAREGRGRFSTVHRIADVPNAITRCLTATG